MLSNAGLVYWKKAETTDPCALDGLHSLMIASGIVTALMVAAHGLTAMGSVIAEPWIRVGVIPVPFKTCHRS